MKNCIKKFYIYWEGIFIKYTYISEEWRDRGYVGGEVRVTVLYLGGL